MSNMMIIENQLRSISLPSRSHPSTTGIEEALTKVKAINTTTGSSESILMALASLEELYSCTEEFLKMGSTQRVMSSSDASEFMEEMLDGSLRLMDTCSVSRDLMVETHEHVRGVQSCVRRKKIAGGIDQLDVAISGYVGFRKNMRNEAKKLIGSLKKIDGGSCPASGVSNGQQDEHLLAVIDAMRRVVSVSVSVLKSFLEFLSGRQSNIKRKLASVLKKKKDLREETKNELESLDSAICCSRDDLQNKLGEVEMSIDGFEKHLEGLFRRLHNTYKARCVSLPVRSHPSVRRIQEVVSRVRALGSSSLESRTMVRDGLSGLTELYRCLSEDLFKSSSETQQTLLNSGLMDELLEMSLKYLEVCGGAKDSASRIKKSVVELQSALRRSKKGGEFSLENDMDAYMASRKEKKKEIKKYMVMSKETDACLESSVWRGGDDQEMSSLVRVMQETSVVTCFVLRTVLSFLSSPKGLKSKSQHQHKGWGIVMKLVKKGIDHHNHEKGFSCLELEAMETEIEKLVTREDQEEEKEISEEISERIQCSLVRSKEVEAAMEELEEGLEGLFKVMIQARVSLLNILST
ncbi:unnamed protein product [Brassica napus]|uniref:(rape) hypothetical protein n=1 Tax=Brassica napus TaxID=3708 RepID=A0A816N6N4_BRANA|nr:unnamed protein product [Brassica napus]